MSTKEDRLGLMAAYYRLPIETINQIASMEKEDRRPSCAQLGISMSVMRTMADYDRYGEARDILGLLEKDEGNVAGLSVLDFGCLVSDYGMFFARRGARVSLYDTAEALDFATFRFRHESLPVVAHTLPTEGVVLMRDVDLVIFGEVLEHIENPLIQVQDCIDANVKYIFTSCYPFGDEEYFQLSGHLQSAQQLQPDCIRLLSTYYDAAPSKDKAVLWKRRGHA